MSEEQQEDDVRPWGPLVPYGPTLLAFCVELHHRLNPIKS
jgi:hypothetical protein